MTTSPQHDGSSNETLAVASIGVVRPPLVYLCSILAETVLDVVWPLPFFPRAFALPVGSSLVVIATALVALVPYSVWKFRAAGTPVPGNTPTTVIVRTGPSRFGRNPIYLAFSLLHLGIAIWINSLWLIASLIVAVAVMVLVVSPREERYLERRFGAGYLEYQSARASLAIDRRALARVDTIDPHSPGRPKGDGR
jgi:protein-S-isoprenylcysteine O-methyltransferase Ste14